MNGYVFLTLIDQGEGVLDKMSVPLTFLQPFLPTSIALTVCDGDSQLFVTFLLQTVEGLPTESFDNLMDFGIKWVEFDPVPEDANYFSLMIAKSGLQIGSRAPVAYADTRDDSSLSRAFYQSRQPEFAVVKYVSPCWPFRMKPAAMLARLKLHQSILDEPISLYLLSCDAKSNTPDTLVAVSDDINTAVNSLLLSNDSESRSEIVNVTCP